MPRSRMNLVVLDNPHDHITGCDKGVLERVAAGRTSRSDQLRVREQYRHGGELHGHG